MSTQSIILNINKGEKVFRKVIEPVTEEIEDEILKIKLRNDFDCSTYAVWSLLYRKSN